MVLAKKSSNRSTWVDAACRGRGFALSLGLTGVGEPISVIAVPGRSTLSGISVGPEAAGSGVVGEMGVGLPSV